MLAALGPIVFDIVNDLQSMEQSEESSFAKHDVMGSSPSYEDTGDEESSYTLSGTMHPHFYGAGQLRGLEALRQARRQKVPLILMRGNFKPEGWFLIKKISQKDEDLDIFDGIGGTIEFSVTLIKVGNPGLGMAEAVLGIWKL